MKTDEKTLPTNFHEKRFGASFSLENWVNSDFLCFYFLAASEYKYR